MNARTLFALCALGASATAAPQIGGCEYATDATLLGSLNAKWLIPGDFNSDGLPDLATCGGGSHLTVLLGTGGGSFASLPVPSLSGGVRAGVAVDLDGDTILDLAVVSTSGGFLRVAYGLGDGTFTSSSSYAVGNNPLDVAFGDLNLDGHMDLVVANWGGDKISIVLGEGERAFSPALNIPVGDKPVAVAVGNLDAGAFPDIVVAKENDGASDLLVLLGAGDGAFVVGGSYATGLAPSDLELIDLSGDGLLDAVVTNSASNTVSVVLGVGAGVFSPEVSYPVGVNPRACAVGDVTRDGVLDVVVACAGSQELRVLRGTGGGVFEPITTVNNVGAVSKVIVGNFDGFGYDDAIYTNPSTLLLNGIVDKAPAGINCATASILAPGLLEDVPLTSFGDHYYAFDVLYGQMVDIALDSDSSVVDLDCYMYSPDTFGTTCGDGVHHLASSTSPGYQETIFWSNDTGVTQTYFLGIVMNEQTSPTACGSYDLQLTVTDTPDFVPVCAGDGSLVACPCGNESTDSESGCLSATGLGAKITFLGSSSVAADDAQLQISQARVGQTSVLIQGEALVALPFRDGILCMGNPTERMEYVSLDSVGVGTTQGSIIQQGSIPGPGVIRYYQFWYRDPFLTPCGTGSNLTNGLKVRWR